MKAHPHLMSAREMGEGERWSAGGVRKAASGFLKGHFVAFLPATVRVVVAKFWLCELI